MHVYIAVKNLMVVIIEEDFVIIDVPHYLTQKGGNVISPQRLNIDVKIVEK